LGKGSRSVRSRAPGRTASDPEIVFRRKLIDDDFNCLSHDLLFVEQQLDITGTNPSELTHHDVLSYALEYFFFGVDSCIHEHIHSFFERSTQ
jgi:hypothetical protein